MAFASCAPSGSGSSFGVTPNGPAERLPSKAAAPVIYVANKAGEPNGGTVTVYTTTGTWLRTMHKGITAPTMLAFDKLHNVYVLNAPSKGGGSVAIFSRGGKKFLGRIASKAIKSPTGLALDSKNNIYVLNAASKSTGKGNVLEFAAGTSNLVATIVKGIAKPTQIASDCHGNVYVLNSGSKTVTAYGQKHKLNLTIPGMSAATGLMVTCPGNVYVSQSLVTAPEIRGRVPLSATPTPSPTPSSGPPTGTVTEFAAGSTTASLTIPLTEGIPCDMAPNASDTTVFVMACPAFSSGDGMTMLSYPMDMSTSQLTINVGVTFDIFAAFAPTPGNFQQETLALPRTATPPPDALGTHGGSYNNMQLEIVSITYSSSSSGAYNVVGVDEPTMGDPVAIISD
jgi:hypothetical protein